MADWLIGDCRCSCVLFDFSGASGVFSPRPRCPDRHGAETRLRGNHPYHLVDFVSIFCITGFFCWLLYFVASSRAQKKSNLIKMFILPILSLKNKIKIQILLKTWSQNNTYLGNKRIVQNFCTSRKRPVIWNPVMSSYVITIVHLNLKIHIKLIFEIGKFRILHRINAEIAICQ